MASDFKLLKDHSEYGHLIVRPVTSVLKIFLAKIVSSIDGLTYHQYYMDNQKPVSKFYDPDTLDDLITMYALHEFHKETKH